MKFLWAIIGSYPRPGRGIGIHALSGRGAGQQLEKNLKVLKSRNHLLDSHQSDQYIGQSKTHASVAFGLEDNQRPVFGDGKIGPTQAYLHSQELFAKKQPGSIGKIIWFFA